jgi:cytochrome d ubiquinol oxidase subunit II
LAGYGSMFYTIQAIIAGSLLVALSIYLVSGGADFGGGIWGLLASGPRKEKQRDLIEQSIEPIWEANHVWLVLVVVLLFTGFPLAFANIMTFLHIPLLIVLLGIVLRGASFSFKSNRVLESKGSRFAARLFSISSLFTPFLLGTAIGTIASGRMPERARGAADFIYPWLGLFPLWIGGFTLVLVAYLSAVYLTVEAENNRELQQDFRLRAIIAALLSGIIAAGGYVVTDFDAPVIRLGLFHHWWSWPPQAGAIVLGLVALILLWVRRFRAARICAVAQLVCVVWGWGLAQFPYLVVPQINLFNAGASKSTLWVLLYSLIGGAVFLGPSFGFLYSVFNKIRPEQVR